jgi:hypothetical protein
VVLPPPASHGELPTPSVHRPQMLPIKRSTTLSLLERAWADLRRRRHCVRQVCPFWCWKRETASVEGITT